MLVSTGNNKQRTGMIHRTLHLFSVDMKAMVRMCIMSSVGIIIEHTCSCLKKTKQEFILVSL